MADFIFRANIERYEKQLEQETDPQKGATLRTLLAEEKAKLRVWQANQGSPKAP